MSDEYEFYIFTRDRDQGENQSYPNVPLDTWTTFEKARVYYTAKLTAWNLHRRLKEVDPDIIYLNSFFSGLTIWALVLRRLGLFHNRPTILAPRGEFSPGALQIRSTKKLLFRKLASRVGLYRNIIWHASSPLELSQISNTDIVRHPGNAKGVILSHEIPDASMFSDTDTNVPRPKQIGEVNFVFVSGILPKKNLRMALELLSTLRGMVRFSIVGPQHDTHYWSDCQEIIRGLPAHIQVEYHGPIPHEAIPDMYQKHHFLVLPTRGENFGYVILESLAAGCPVLISDATPWHELDQHEAGWDIPLSAPSQWQSLLQLCVDMDQEEYTRRSHAAQRFARQWIQSTPFKEAARRLFDSALAVVRNRN